MNSTIDVRDKTTPMPNMVNTAVFACPLGLIHAVIKKPPHTAKKIAESSNLVDFIVNSSVSAANATRSVFSCGMSSVFPSVSVCIYYIIYFPDCQHILVIFLSQSRFSAALIKIAIQYRQILRIFPVKIPVKRALQPVFKRQIQLCAHTARVFEPHDVGLVIRRIIKIR